MPGRCPPQSLSQLSNTEIIAWVTDSLESLSDDELAALAVRILTIVGSRVSAPLHPTCGPLLALLEDKPPLLRAGSPDH